MNGGARLILARHGEATSTVDNPERPLTIVGRRHAEKVAAWLGDHGFRVERIAHSGKLRARQTAKVFGSRLGIHAANVREAAGLEPYADPVPVAAELEVDERPLMIVGHLPFLNRLASQLLAGDPDRIQFKFVDAGVVVLSRNRGMWQIDAVVGHDV